MTAPRDSAVDPAWVARQLARAPKHLTDEQQRRLRAVLVPNRKASA